MVCGGYDGSCTALGAGNFTTAETPLADSLSPDERERYAFPVLKVIGWGSSKVSNPPASSRNILFWAQS